MKQRHNLHPTAPKTLEKPLSKFFSKHPTAKKLAMGSLILADMAGGFGFAAKDGLARPPDPQTTSAPISPKPIPSLPPLEGTDSLYFERFGALTLLKDIPSSEIKQHTEKFGHVYDTFTREGFNVTRVQKDGKTVAAFISTATIPCAAVSGYFVLENGDVGEIVLQSNKMKETRRVDPTHVKVGRIALPDGGAVFMGDSSIFVFLFDSTK